MTGPNGQTDDTTPSLTWDRVAGAERLELWVNRSDADGTQKVIHQENLPGNGTSFIANSQLSPGRYQAWLKGYDGQNRSGGWSQPVSFRIGGGAAERGVITGTTTRNGASAISWNSIAGADRVEVWINRVANDGSGDTRVIHQQNLAGTTTEFSTGQLPASPRIVGFTWITENGATRRVPVYQFNVQLQGIGLTTARNTQYELSIVEYRQRGASPFNWMPSFAFSANSGENESSTQVPLTGPGQTRIFKVDRAFTLFG